MKLLVLGGTGFFGKSILDSFLRGRLKKHNINSICVLSRSTENFLQKYPEFKNDNIKCINGDITRISSLPEADIIIHAATSTNQYHYKLNSNIERLNIELGAKNYIKIAKKIHKKSKIVYCSSGAVYGKQPSEIEKIDEKYLFQDITHLHPLKRDYALGKRNAEIQFKEFGNTGFNVAIARCFAFYGDYLPEDGHFAYSSFLKSAKKGEDIKVTADNVVIRSYMHADDLVESLIRIAFNSDNTCPIYNVGSDKEISIFDLANKIASNYNVKVIKLKNIDLKEIDRYVPNTNKLKSLFKTNESH